MSKTYLVTGASGFLGLHLCRVLLDAGHTVIGMGRRHNDRVAALGIEQRLGSVADAEAVSEALKGVDGVYHLAGTVTREKGAQGLVYEVHVKGTRTVLQGCVDAGVNEVLVLSTSGTVGVSESPSFVATEDDDIAWDLINPWPYYQSKGYMEKEVAAFVAGGLPVKMARPTLLLGPGDYAGSSTGDVVKFICGDVKASLPGGVSFVDVRDVAAALPLIMADGEPGVGYLMGGKNCEVRDFLLQLEQVSGVKAPAMTVPKGVTDRAGKWLKKVTRLKAFGGLQEQTFEMGCCYWYIDSSKAEGLGFVARDPAVTLRDTVEDLRPGV